MARIKLRVPRGCSCEAYPFCKHETLRQGLKNLLGAIALEGAYCMTVAEPDRLHPLERLQWFKIGQRIVAKYPEYLTPKEDET